MGDRRRRYVFQRYALGETYHTRCGTRLGECDIRRGWWCPTCEEFADTDTVAVPIKTFIDGVEQK